VPVAFLAGEWLYQRRPLRVGDGFEVDVGRQRLSGRIIGLEPEADR
jgi:hypothetical protein